MEVETKFLRLREPIEWGHNIDGWRVAHTSKSSDQSFIVNTEKNAWACHSDSFKASRGGRGGGNVLDFVAALERCSVRDAALKLQDWFAVTAMPAPMEQIISATEGAHSSVPTGTVESKPANGLYTQRR